jgi:DNA-binding transcriptional LysR family regulator
MKETLESSLKNLRVADVELFVSAAQLNSLGKSASLHHLSQSAASAAILRVETAFGTSLCAHEKKRFRLTQQGQVLLPLIEHWIKQLHRLIISEQQAPIRIVTTHAIAQIAVPTLLPLGPFEFKHMRPDQSYGAILRNEADIALVLDNAPWKGVMAKEIGKGHFQLYSSCKEATLNPVLLPEDQMEVLFLQQRWQEIYQSPLPVKSRIPSWSLIAQICAESQEIGFLPDFLAQKFKLHPVPWQPTASSYRILALYREPDRLERFDLVLRALYSAFTCH